MNLKCVIYDLFLVVTCALAPIEATNPGDGGVVAICSSPEADIFVFTCCNIIGKPGIETRGAGLSIWLTKQTHRRDDSP